MRVLQLIDTLDAGGAERMAVNIANALSQEGVNSSICATRHAGSLEKEIFPEVSTFLLGKKGTLDIKAFRRFFKWVKREKIEVIHAHSTSILLAVLVKIRNRKLKIVWHDHYGLSDALQQRPSRAMRVLAKYVDVAIAVNQSLAEWSKKVLKIEKVLFLRNFAVVSKSMDKSTVLKGQDGKRVLCLANLRPQKNHLELIEGFAKTIDRFPEWTLHLVGKSFEDEYATSIQKHIVSKKMENNIFLYGSCMDVAHILEQATIGVLVSVSEGLPVSLLEYGHHGLPVIVTDVGQCAEVVGTNGVVIKKVQEELPEALLRFYKNMDNERELLGLRFRESVQKTFSKEAFMEKVLPIYKALIT